MTNPTQPINTLSLNDKAVSLLTFIPSIILKTFCTSLRQLLFSPKAKDMSQQSQFLTLFIILASFSTCFSSYKEDPHATNGGPDPIAHTTSMGTINEGNKHEPRFMDFMKSQTKRFGLKTRLSSASTSQKLVNVDDFGAKANGGDDTEVYIIPFKKAYILVNFLYSVFKFFLFLHDLVLNVMLV